MKADYHIHTSFSDDCDYPMEEVIQEAISKGLDEICITEHVDYGVHFDRDKLPEDRKEELLKENKVNVDYPAYLARLEELKEKYKNQITVKKGLEYGIQVSTIPDFENLYKTYDLDFIINSCHQADNLEFWNQDYQKGKSQRDYHVGYYTEILNVAKNYHHYNVLGHLDHQIRYDLQGEYLTKEIDDLIDEILVTAIKDDKGIEVNTSGFHYKIGDFHPSKSILKRYYDLGGKIITIGSDSHTPGRVGDKVDEAKEALKTIGFKEFCTFENMKPIFHQL